MDRFLLGARHRQRPSQAAQPVSKKRSFRSKWESPKQKLMREHREHYVKLRETLNGPRRQWHQDRSAGKNPAGCDACFGTMCVLEQSRHTNDGFAYFNQCQNCLDAVITQGWGDETTLSQDEDRSICRLLNEHGMPSTTKGAPSPMHFHKSFIHFHSVLSSKDFGALVHHLETKFSTTRTTPNRALTGYQGWYRKDTLVHG